MNRDNLIWISCGSENSERRGISATNRRRRHAYGESRNVATTKVKFTASVIEQHERDERCLSWTVANAAGNRQRSTAADDGAFGIVVCCADEIVIANEAATKSQKPAFCSRTIADLHFDPATIRYGSAEWQPVTRLQHEFGAVQGKISVFLQEPLVIGEQLHRIARLEEIRFDRVVHLRF